ncbi:MAG: polysaccharide biosynthesis/export family protein [Thermodesulfobacteriota bacterium]|nr:polysaccharide biosynthesis/export family protein [Thermodesulfobacteriota bacterium]
MKKLWKAGLIILTACACFALAAVAYGEEGDEGAKEPLSVAAAASGEEAEEEAKEYQFVLGPGDVLEISVWGDDSLTKQVLVRPDGRISFPLIGDVKAKGLNVEFLRLEIEKRIEEYVQDTPVTVLLTQLGSPRVFVMGKVARPGVYVMNDRMRVMQMLAMAGGLTSFADSNGILIIREREGEQSVINFNYDKVENGKDLSQNIVLLPGDTVIVP